MERSGSPDDTLPCCARMLRRTEKSPAFARVLWMAPDTTSSSIFLVTPSANRPRRAGHSVRLPSAPQAKPLCSFRYPFFETFHLALIERAFSGRSVQLLRISAGDHALAHLYSFRRGDRISAYQSGLDDSKRGLRPGYVSQLLAMALSAGEGATRHEFLAGDNQLKRSLGAGALRLYSHRFQAPSLGLRIEAGFRSACQRFRFWRCNSSNRLQKKRRHPMVPPQILEFCVTRPRSGWLCSLAPAAAYRPQGEKTAAKKRQTYRLGNKKRFIFGLEVSQTLNSGGHLNVLG
jgi:hypothetical protein